MKKITTILLFTLLTITAMAQVQVKGKVLDANGRQPIDFVNVYLTEAKSTTPTCGTSTDADGIFVLQVNPGTYTLHASLIGYQEYTKQLTITQATDLGKIIMKEDAKQLDEVEVVGQGSTMRFELDKKVFTVDQSIASSGGSASDVLQNIPSVDVDNEGNISLRNSESVEVWINGKPSGLTADNRGQILQQLPAESIKEIELITNPSAKYNPEGTAGVINIVMKKDSKPGYYGSVQAGINYAEGAKAPGYNIDANINYTQSIVSAYLNLGYRRNRMSGSNTSDRYNYLGADTTRLYNDGNNERAFGGFFLRTGVDFTINRHSFGVSAFAMLGDKSTNTATKNYSLSQLQGGVESPLRQYQRLENNTGGRPGYNFSGYYRFKITDKQDIDFNLSYNAFNSNQHSIYQQTNTLTNTYENGQKQDTKDNNGRWEAKADYTNKFTKNSRLEAGWQSTFSHSTQTSQAFDYFQDGTTGQELKLFYNGFTSDEQIHALYITYGNRFWDRFSVQVGLRGEYMKRTTQTTDYDTRESNGTPTEITKSYWQLFPSAYLSYSFKNNHELQLNYTRRVDRARGHQINPFKNLSDSTNIHYGNPDLLPQFTHSLELNYLKTWEKNTLSAGLYYKYTDPTSQNVRYLSSDNVMYSTYVNISKQHNLGFEVVDKLRVGTWLQLTASVNGYWGMLTGDSSYIQVTNDHGTTDPVLIRIDESRRFSWSARLNANFLFMKSFTGQLSARYRSANLVAQGRNSASYTIDLGLRKTFFDNQLALAFNVRDLLNSNGRKKVTWGDNFYQENLMRWNARSYNFTITYSFGNMKSKKKPQDGGASEMMNSYEESYSGAE